MHNWPNPGHSVLKCLYRLILPPAKYVSSHFLSTGYYPNTWSIFLFFCQFHSYKVVFQVIIWLHIFLISNQVEHLFICTLSHTFYHLELVYIGIWLIFTWISCFVKIYITFLYILHYNQSCILQHIFPVWQLSNLCRKFFLRTKYFISMWSNPKFSPLCYMFLHLAQRTLFNKRTQKQSPNFLLIVL